ncbi:30S ribosomal protein S3 [candidate division WWE3 bacterium]|nr:30S ribosomal protein S3 [candidate division WWE3 bacterium]
MGQKINPTGFRVGISKNWTSRWYADDKQYARNAIEDFRIRRFLEEKFESAGVKEINIERSLNEINIVVSVAKPGMVIGRGGAGVESVQADLGRITKSKVFLTAEEVKTPELQARFVAEYICRQLKRRFPYRRVVNSAANTAMDKGAKGIRIKVAGLLSGSNSISRSEIFLRGSVPAQTLRADIDYAQIDCHLLYGTVGIKVWIYKGEVELIF